MYWLWFDPARVSWTQHRARCGGNSQRIIILDPFPQVFDSISGEIKTCINDSDTREHVVVQMFGIETNHRRRSGVREKAVGQSCWFHRKDVTWSRVYKMGRIFVIKEKVGSVGGEQGEKKKRKAGGRGRAWTSPLKEIGNWPHQRRELVLDSSIRWNQIVWGCWHWECFKYQHKECV